MLSMRALRRDHEHDRPRPCDSNYMRQIYPAGSVSLRRQRRPRLPQQLWKMRQLGSASATVRKSTNDKMHG